MSKKIDRALYGPGWLEVTLGAVLSVALGLVLAAAYLVFKPVTQVKELPKEPALGMVYSIAGSQDPAKARQVASKQKIFAQGGSVSLKEDELNAAAAPAAPLAAPGKAALAAPEPAEVLSAGAPNFRLRGGLLQFSVPVRVRYPLVGLDATFLIQATGSFERSGDLFVYRPSQLYLGSCPVQRLPLVDEWVTDRMFNAGRFPAELVAAWGRLTGVTIEGDTLKLTMPPR